MNSEFWNDIVKNANEHIFINGCCYYIEKKNRYLKGYDGNHFKIQLLKTGEIIETDNLWFNGEIPKEYKSILPDSAKFV